MWWSAKWLYGLNINVNSKVFIRIAYTNSRSCPFNEQNIKFVEVVYATEKLV